MPTAPPLDVPMQVVVSYPSFDAASEVVTLKRPYGAHCSDSKMLCENNRVFWTGSMLAVAIGANRLVWRDAGAELRTASGFTLPLDAAQLVVSYRCSGFTTPRFTPR